jgi:hypothetical protein
MELYQESNKCPKTGDTGGVGKYHAAGKCELEAEEHIHRTCPECEYEWAEAPNPDGASRRAVI